MSFALFIMFCIGFISIVVGIREHKKEQREHWAFYPERLGNKLWLLSVTKTTKEAKTFGRFKGKPLKID